MKTLANQQKQELLLRRKMHAFNALNRIKNQEMREAIERERARSPKYIVELKNGITLLPKTKERYKYLLQKYGSKVVSHRIIK